MNRLWINLILINKTNIYKSFNKVRNLSSLNCKNEKSSINFNLLKYDSCGCDNMYAIFKIHNIPYLVSKGDKIYLPYKLKNVEVGDILKLNNVTTLGSPNYSYNDKNGISEDKYVLKATIVEITRAPSRELIKKTPRCRRVKTVLISIFQTVLMITELKLL